MLTKAMEEVRKARLSRWSMWTTVVIAEAPKMAPHRETMRKTIASCFDRSPPWPAIQVRGKTNEGLGCHGPRQGDRGRMLSVLLRKTPRLISDVHLQVYNTLQRASANPSSSMHGPVTCGCTSAASRRMTSVTWAMRAATWCSMPIRRVLTVRRASKVRYVQNFTDH